MEISLQEVQRLEMNEVRKRWAKDKSIKKYICNQHKRPAIPSEYFKRYFEIYEDGELVGDIKVFLVDDDADHKRAQLLVVLGKRLKGIGSKAVSMLMDILKHEYKMVYCIVDRKNVASVRMLKKNQFIVEDINKKELFLVRYLKKS